MPADIPLPYRVTAVLQPTGETTGRTIAQLVVDTISGKPVETLHRLEKPVIEAGETDGPLR